MMEILAPVGGIDSLKAAVYNKADAVYLGLTKFNARMKADNFTEENLKEWVSFAHLFNVKVYLAINTLIKNSEMNEALRLVETGINANVDAFIMADLGLIYLASRLYKNIVIHASTQMGICNLSGAKQVEKLGVKRVVLARETKLEDIKLIKDNTNLEIEFFVQGALCVAFSGNCYYSSERYGKSGNRGECLQPCRLKFKLNDGEFKTLLSPRDLCLITHLDELEKAGVCSLKIEGRNRRAAYVAQAVRSYRNALNKFNVLKEIEELKAVYSRGDFNYDAYLFKDKDSKIINPQTSGHSGVKIGKVIKSIEYKKGLYKLTISSSHQLKQSDGLKIFNNGKEIVSLGVGNVINHGGQYDIFSRANIFSGDVYLTVNSQKENELSFYSYKLKVSAEFSAFINEKASLMLNYKDVSIKCYSDFIVQEAKTQPLKKEDIEILLEKTKDTYFEINEKKIILENVFISKAELNQIKRNALEMLKNEILKTYNKKNIPQVFKTNYQLPIIKKINAQDMLEPVMLPCYVRQKDIKEFDNLGCKEVVFNNLWGLDLKDKELIAGPYLNVFNDYSILALKSLGAKEACYSPELKEDEIGEAGYVFEGRKYLMQFCHCPFLTEFGGECKSCKFKENSIIKAEDLSSYELIRNKINGVCYFAILSNCKTKYNNNNPKLINNN